MHHDIRVVISGEITEEFEGGLYKIIDSYNLPGDRDAVIDVFDTVAYYTDTTPLAADWSSWFRLYLELRDLKGTKNVELSVGDEIDNEEE